MNHQINKKYKVPNIIRSKIIKQIITYYQINGRDFPWRQFSDPYVILVTEMMLRKTTAKKLINCWDEFFNKYPSIDDLAATNPSDIESIIYPLGLQKQRARDFKKMASQIVGNHNSIVPIKYDKLIKIHGIGVYSANATLCFAFQKIVPIVDVNVARIYSRIFGWKWNGDIYRNQDLNSLADYLLPKRKGKIKQFNYGLLDFGAKMCRATSPLCDECMFDTLCLYPGVEEFAKEKK